MKTRAYMQLMLLAGPLFTAMPLSAHQLGHDAQTASTGFWTNMGRTLAECAQQFAPSYLFVLFLLLSVLLFIAYKVKWADHS